MNFMDALDTKTSDLPKPKNIPQGTYNWAVIKHDISEIKSAKGHWDAVNFSVRPVEAHGDVDQNELDAYGPLSAGLGRVSFMITREGGNEALVTQERLVKFLKDTLMIDGAADMTLKELLAASTNMQFMAQCLHRMDGDNVYVDVKNYQPLA